MLYYDRIDVSKGIAFRESNSPFLTVSLVFFFLVVFDAIQTYKKHHFSILVHDSKAQ